MSRMWFVTLTLIWALPVKAEVLTLSCDGTMKADGAGEATGHYQDGTDC